MLFRACPSETRTLPERLLPVTARSPWRAGAP